jgi:hypothetical protein
VELAQEPNCGTSLLLKQEPKPKLSKIKLEHMFKFFSKQAEQFLIT